MERQYKVLIVDPGKMLELAEVIPLAEVTRIFAATSLTI